MKKILSHLQAIRKHFLAIALLAVTSIILSGCVAAAAAGAGAAGGYEFNKHYQVKKKEPTN